jgi:hypothetical protein
MIMAIKEKNESKQESSSQSQPWLWRCEKIVENILLDGGGVLEYRRDEESTGMA